MTIDDKHSQMVGEADYAQLCRLVIEAAWRVDIGQPDTLNELFTADGELNLGESTLKGREAIRNWGRELAEAHPYGCIRHVCGNMRFVDTGDDTAEGVTILTVFMEEGDGLGSAVPWVVGEDHDRFVRTPEGWRIASRPWKALFVRKTS
jgi:SnoaL-like domain